MISITRQFGFDAGHRVLGHESKCANLHGHRYLAEVTVTAPKLDGLSRVVDFSVLKEKVGKWIDDYWDHTMILNVDDPLAIALQTPQCLISHASGLRFYQLQGPKAPYIMDYGKNPTAEVLAQELATVAQKLLQADGLEVTHVRLWETPNCYVDWNLS